MHIIPLTKKPAGVVDEEVRVAPGPLVVSLSISSYAGVHKFFPKVLNRLKILGATGVPY